MISMFVMILLGHNEISVHLSIWIIYTIWMNIKIKNSKFSVQSVHTWKDNLYTYFRDEIAVFARIWRDKVSTCPYFNLSLS